MSAVETEPEGRQKEPVHARVWRWILGALGRILLFGRVILALAGLAALGAGIYVAIGENTATALLIVGGVVATFAILGPSFDEWKLALGNVVLTARRAQLADELSNAAATGTEEELRSAVKAAAQQLGAEVAAEMRLASSRNRLAHFLLGQSAKYRTSEVVTAERATLEVRSSDYVPTTLECNVTDPHGVTTSTFAGTLSLVSGGSILRVAYPQNFIGAKALRPGGTYKVEWSRSGLDPGTGPYGALAVPTVVVARSTFTVPDDEAVVAAQGTA